MARFRLKEKHYILTDPPEEWEQKETDQQTGRQGTKRYKVPRFLDPGDPSHWTGPGEIIVSTKLSPQFPRDIIFEGPPTPDMEPLDDEAIELLRGNEKKDPFLGYDDRSYSDRLLEKLHEAAMSQPAAPRADDGLASQIAELKAQIAALQKPTVTRR